MPIDFSRSRWQKVKQNAQDWWDGKLGRPLIQIVLTGHPSRRSKPKLSQAISYATSYDLSVTPEEIVDRWDYELSGHEFLGDSFPSVFPNFGPGVVAAYLGARPEPVDWTVWFHPEKEQEAGDIRLAIDPNNAWLRRVKDICRAAIARWEGMVQVGMTDLGGNLDVLSTFRPGEKLLLDLVDFPDEIKRLAWEAHAGWWKAFDDINSVLRPVNPGYTSWASIFSEKPNYMLQCDFSYMIGPEMFDEFARPELEASCQRLSQSFYHLDGVGQLPHLDLLLAIKELNGVQWVPGGGKPPCECWPEVYRKIIKAGKRAHFIGNWRDFDRLVDQVGGAENFFLSGTEPPENRREVEAFLKRYGVM